MNPAKDNIQASQSGAVSPPVTSGISKEHEIASIGAEQFKEIAPKLEVPEEVEKLGVTKIGETIELPQDITKLGVTHAGPTAPVAATLPSVTLPISDQQVVVGLHTKVVGALRWLAVWCVKKLKKAHLALKVVHGKIMRVKTG